jgi:SAM-dependent methyltransferase
MHHRFEDADQWSKVFDDPARDAWQEPAELVASLQLQPGQSVADIGAGTGYFERHLAAAVGPTGRVIAIDIEPDMVAHLSERARREETPQVEARLGAPDDPKLAPGEVDLVLLVDTYHHVDDRVAYFGRLKAALRPGGRLVVVDFRPDGDPAIGPPLAHRLTPDQVRDELGRAGWTPLAAPDLLPQQYVLVFGL